MPLLATKENTEITEGDVRVHERADCDNSYMMKMEVINAMDIIEIRSTCYC